jgi:serine/threonine protein kinase
MFSSCSSDRYVLGKMIEKGGEGTVFQGRWGEDGPDVAIKRFHRSYDSSACEKFREEVRIMDLVACDSIVSLWGASIVEEEGGEVRREMVLELLEGDLLTLAEEEGALLEDEARCIIRQVMEALYHCHSLHVFHRDVKLENILISEHGQIVKLADFGKAVQSEDGLVLGMEGTEQYLAPELFVGGRRGKADGAKADVWSAGIVLFALLTGRMPFARANKTDKAFRLWSSGRIDQFWADFEYFGIAVSSEAKEVLQTMLAVDPRERADVQQLMEKEWFHLWMEEEEEEEEET